MKIAIPIVSMLLKTIIPMPKGELNPYQYPTKNIDAYCQIMDADAYIAEEFDRIRIFLTVEGADPVYLPVKSIEQAEGYLQNDAYYQQALKNVQYKIFEKKWVALEEWGEENIAIVRQGLNYLQINKIKNDWPRHYLSFSNFRTYRLNVTVQNGFLCFDLNQALCVRANFFVDGKEPQKALMAIDGFSEIITRFFNENEAFTKWTPIVTEWGVQISVS